MKYSRRFAVQVFLVVLFSAMPAIADNDGDPGFRIDHWLVLGPLQVEVPAFDVREGGEVSATLLEEAVLPLIHRLPVVDRAIEGFSGRASWRSVEVGDDGFVGWDTPSRVGDGKTAIVWLATQVRTTRYIKAQLDIDCEHGCKIILDGSPVTGDDIELEPGDHVVFVATVFDPEVSGPWRIASTIVTEMAGGITADVDPIRELGILDVLDAAAVTAFDLSPTGDRVVLTQSKIRPGTDERETWVELRTAADGVLLQSWHGSSTMSEVRFAPTGNRLSWVTRNIKEKTTSFWVADLDDGTTREVVHGVESWDGYLWSPTGRKVVFGSTEEPDENETGIKRLRGLLDRMADHRQLSRLHLVTVSNGVWRQLTGGPVSSSAVAFSPDGSRLLVTREVEDLSRRPYTRQELWELDLESGDAIKLRDFRWLSGVQYAPDGRRLLVQAGPSEFGEVGIAVKGKGPINDYDGQLFVFDPETKAVEALTHDFNPSVTDVSWSRHDGFIYLLAVDGHRRSLFKYGPDDGIFSPLHSGIESVRSFEIAAGGSTIVASGSSLWQPQRLVVFASEQEPARLLLEPAAQRFASVRRGDVQKWDFSTADGRLVVGRVYLPTSFEPDRRYPAIVNYYAGTSPMDRSFGGRYPAEWWAANGYVVYVLTPTGAYGWGQEDSTVHVNDWGEITSRQIVEATEAFLEAHPFVDPERVGCIGASYGGFMTMTLVTKTDLFAAAVAHAGISALTSYWGEGYWGYSYGAVANADSFPWNRRDIFVDRSPLFHADKVTTPVLLTHGDDDPNVPPGESDQFYAALKLLGVEVEYLRVVGLGHLIMEHDKRALWSKSIVAWFDRWLKDEPQFWEALYPEEW